MTKKRKKSTTAMQSRERARTGEPPRKKVVEVIYRRPFLGFSQLGTTTGRLSSSHPNESAKPVGELHQVTGRASFARPNLDAYPRLAAPAGAFARLAEREIRHSRYHEELAAEAEYLHDMLEDR